MGLHSSTNRRPNFNCKVAERDLSVPVSYSLYEIGKCYLPMLLRMRLRKNTFWIQSKKESEWAVTGNFFARDSLQMRIFCACIFLAISNHFLCINKQQLLNTILKNGCDQKFPYFLSDFLFLNSEERAFPYHRNVTIGTLHPFFLSFLFALNLTISCDCWCSCFPWVFRFDCFCQRLSEIVLGYQRQEEEDSLVLVHGSH